VGIPRPKKSDRPPATGARRAIDWRRIFSRIIRECGCTYEEAGRMTLPQVMHAMGGEGSDDRQEIEGLVFGKQCEVLDRIVARMGWRRRRVLDLPVSEVAAQIQGEPGAKAPPLELLPGILSRYVDQAI
jgi:hypothetical protein